MSADRVVIAGASLGGRFGGGHDGRSTGAMPALYRDDGRVTTAVTAGWPRASVAARQVWERGAIAAEFRDRLAQPAESVSVEKKGERR